MVLLVISVAGYHWAESKKGERKPLPQKKWYLINKVEHQVSTAYTEPYRAPVSSSGRPYFIGGVAVHPKVPGGSHLDPIIPFGTVIYLAKPQSITINNRSLNAFVVIDTGDANWSLWPDSPYWVDFYFGPTNYWNQKAASSYGKRYIDYYWFEPFE